MPVTAADLRFFASQNMTDTADGGGPRGATVVQDGVEANIFPIVSSSDRSTGRVHLRKVYPSLTNADTAALLGASVAINEVPTDANASVVLFATGNALTTRAQAAAALEGSLSFSFANLVERIGLVPLVDTSVVVSFASGGNSVTLPSNSGGIAGGWTTRALTIVPAVGAEVLFSIGGVLHLRTVTARTEQTVDSGAWVGSNSIDVTPAMPTYAAPATMRVVTTTVAGPRAYGYASVPGAVASAATSLAVSSVRAQVIPYAGSGAYTTANYGLAPLPLEASLGKVPIVLSGDIATLWHETATSPATATNGGMVNTGRTNLDQLAIVGSDGKEIARFLANGPAPTLASGAASADLATGIVTFTSVTGWAQPVSVRHRISHRSAVSAVVGATVTLATATTRSFPAGAVLSTHVPLGDLYARAYGLIAQQAWTRVWSDSLIGNPVPMMFSGAIGCANAGAETDRWAAVFDSGNTFKVYSERLGQVASGNTETDFAPINPATGAPFFTLLATGWTPGILVGSVLRFNTSAAAAPVWGLRCISPSAAAGTVSAALRLHGSV